MDEFITGREVLATIPKAPDVDTRLSIVTVAGTAVLEVQDITRSTGHVGRGWYVTRDAAGRACAQRVAEVLAAFSGEEM